jgi:hypothetical protein
MRTVAIIGNGDSGLNCIAALELCARSKGIVLFHVSELNIAETIPETFKPNLIFEITKNNTYPIIDEFRIPLDKYGIPLTNPRSKYHK